MCLHDIERAAHDTGWLEFEQICRGTVYGSAAANTGGFRHMLLATTRSPRRLSLAVFVFRRYCTSGKAYESGTFCCLAWSCAGGSRSGSFRTGSKFFLRVDGRLFSRPLFLALLPARLWWTNIRHSSGRSCKPVVVGTMVTTSSLRRGGSTAEASAGVAADLRSASDVGGLRAHHYTWSTCTRHRYCSFTVGFSPQV